MPLLLFIIQSSLSTTQKRTCSHYAICRQTLSARNNRDVKSELMPYSSGLVYIISGTHSKTSGIAPLENNSRPLEYNSTWQNSVDQTYADKLETGAVVDQPLRGRETRRWQHPLRSFSAISSGRAKYMMMVSNKTLTYPCKSFTLTVIQKMHEGAKCHLGMQQKGKGGGLSICRATKLISKAVWRNHCPHWHSIQD